MSRFSESSSDEWNPENMVPTGYGFCLRMKNMPRRTDVRWLKVPEEHIYFYDGDGWHRLDPPEPKFIPAGDLNHG